MWGGDLVGAYLVTRGNKDYPIFIKTSRGIEVPPGIYMQAVGNLQPKTSPLALTHALRKWVTRTLRGILNYCTSGSTINRFL